MSRLIIWMPVISKRAWSWAWAPWRRYRPRYAIYAVIERGGELTDERELVTDRLSFDQAYAICELHNVEARAFWNVPDPEECP